MYSSLCLNFFHLLARKPNLEKISIYSSKFFHNFHLFESSFTCPGLRASGLVRRLCTQKDLDTHIQKCFNIYIQNVYYIIKLQFTTVNKSEIWDILIWVVGNFCKDFIFTDFARYEHLKKYTIVIFVCSNVYPVSYNLHFNSQNDPPDKHPPVQRHVLCSLK